MSDMFQIVSGRETELFKDMGLIVEWRSTPNRMHVVFDIHPASQEKFVTRREILVGRDGDVEIKPGIVTMKGSLELRQWASLLIWCLRTSYDKVYYIFPDTDQLRFK